MTMADEITEEKTTWRMPYGLIKQAKQFALDTSTKENKVTLQDVANRAFAELLEKHGYLPKELKKALQESGFLPK